MTRNFFYMIAIACVFFISCNKDVENKDINIVPRPQSCAFQKGHFILNAETSVFVENVDEKSLSAIDIFCKQARCATGFPLLLKIENSDKNRIICHLISDKNLGEEGYSLLVDKNNVEISANAAAGLFYGLQSLLQLFPPEIFSEKKMEHINWEAPCIKILDQPRFAYRGAHLDVARHYFTLDSIKRYIDHLARYKMNRFHWHLTDDQGWRIEIERYPKLTTVGGCRKETLIGSYAETPHCYDGTEYCGFYTQDEAREIVRYAAERFIIVISEIEMPGHALAALSAYPELSCDPTKTYEAATTWGVFEDVFCPSETTFAFLENVLTEIINVFPSEYIHIGGDECPKKAWKESRFCQDLIKQKGLKDENGLQSYFIQRIALFLQQHGRQIIGWDEILEGGLSGKSTVLSWRGMEGGIEAAEKGHDVVMAPTSHCYFDYYQANPDTEPLAIGGFVTINKAYHFEPVSDVLPEDKKCHILGAQCNLWTEYIPNFKKVEYMLLPRLLAMSEIGWTSLGNKN